MKYDAAGWWGRAVVQSAHITNSEAKASRLARAMKAVLLAARRYAAAWPFDATKVHREVATKARDRLLAAQARLEKIEKEVSRG